MKLNERLVYARELGSLSAGDAADALGIPRPTYYAHENGSRGFKSKTAERYAQFFGVPFDWLMTGRGSPKAESLSARVISLTPQEQQEVRKFVDYLESLRANPKGRVG